MTVETPALTVAELPAGNVSADSPIAEAWYRITKTALAADIPDFPPPCRTRQLVLLNEQFPGERTRRWLAYLGPDAVGSATLELPTLDNLDNAGIDVVVDPDHRRRGVGRALYERAVEAARAEGRKRITAMSVETLPGGPERDGAGSAFATSMGMANALGEVRRRLDLDSVDDADHDRLLAEAWPKASGYSVVSWTDVVPDEYLDDVAVLEGRLIQDAPMGDLAWEPEKVDGARLRGIEAFRRKYRGRAHQAGMRHDESGRLVAWTMLVVYPSTPFHAWQGTTLVHPDHRGKRLGTIAKIENLRHARAREAELRLIDTWNAAENQHMIGINEAIGFRAVDSWVNWQTDI